MVLGVFSLETSIANLQFRGLNDTYQQKGNGQMDRTPISFEVAPGVSIGQAIDVMFILAKIMTNDSVQTIFGYKKVTLIVRRLGWRQRGDARLANLKEKIISDYDRATGQATLTYP
jgi:hypothetical protein